MVTQKILQRPIVVTDCIDKAIEMLARQRCWWSLDPAAATSHVGIVPAGIPYAQTNDPNTPYSPRQQA